MTFKEFTKSLGSSRVEGELIKTIVVSLVVSFGILILLYYANLNKIQDFNSKFGFFIFFALLSFSLITPAIRQVRAYRQFTCMSGMMIGMTIGMISGFLPGFFAGSTNGMFWGSVLGMTIGITLGIWNGSCCGVMGIMEGIMAGFMGGLMGAMTAVMMYNDNLKLAGVIVFIICAAILIGLNYMIYLEMKIQERQLKEDHFFTAVLTAVLTIITIWLMVYGPRSVLFQ